MSKRKEAPASSPSYSRGAIVRIRLHNFMSYRDAEIADVGTKLNCIIGPNGTGKSTLALKFAARQAKDAALRSPVRLVFALSRGSMVEGYARLLGEL